jgi:oligopeptidase B
MKRDDSNCLWLSGYGAYGIPSRPSFAWNTITLLDFGCVYAIAHVRGGGEFGMQWWHAGSGFNKKNSYNDFIVAADTLVTQGFTRHTRMVIQGKNAGGTMIGAVINKRPDIAKVAILNGKPQFYRIQIYATNIYSNLAPVLDILTAAMDTLDPPADINKSEWGCTSKNKKSYVHIRSYSPYENIKPDVKYPNILVTARHNDPYLKYWSKLQILVVDEINNTNVFNTTTIIIVDPSKWVAKMRASNVENPEHDNDPHTIIFLMNNNAEHCKCCYFFIVSY